MGRPARCQPTIPSSMRATFRKPILTARRAANTEAVTERIRGAPAVALRRDRASGRDIVATVLLVARNGSCHISESDFVIHVYGNTPTGHSLLAPHSSEGSRRFRDRHRLSRPGHRRQRHAVQRGGWCLAPAASLRVARTAGSIDRDVRAPEYPPRRGVLSRPPRLEGDHDLL